MSRLLSRIALIFSILLMVACDNTTSPTTSSAAEPKAAPSENDNSAAVKSLPANTKKSPLIDYQNGLITISAVDISQRELLAKLSKKVGFGLQLNYQQWSSVSLTMTKASVEEVIKAILGPIPHKIFFRADVPGPARVVQGLLVGDAKESSPLASRTAQSMADRLQKMNLPRQDQVEQQAPITKDQVMAMSDEEKIKFLAFVEPSDVNLPVLVDMMKTYPDADVRIAAMASIENADTPQAAQAIVELFTDADPQIVLAAIDSIEFAGSEADIKSLETLLNHPSPAVQSAAREAIDFLR